MDIEIKQEPPIDLDSSFEIAGNSETQNASIHVQDTEQASCSKKRKLSDDYYTPAEINPDNEMQFLLKEWGLEVLSESFAKNLIDVDVLDYILDVDIIDLCRDYPLRYRVVLRHKIKQKSYKRDKEPDQLQRKSAHRKERQTNTLAPQSASESTNELMVPMGSCPSASSGKPSTASLKARSETERQYSLSSSLDDSSSGYDQQPLEVHLIERGQFDPVTKEGGQLSDSGDFGIDDVHERLKQQNQEQSAADNPVVNILNQKIAHLEKKYSKLDKQWELIHEKNDGTRTFTECEGYIPAERLRRYSDEAASDYTFVKLIMDELWPEGFAGRSVTGRSSNNVSGCRGKAATPDVGMAVPKIPLEADKIEYIRDRLLERRLMMGDTNTAALNASKHINKLMARVIAGFNSKLKQHHTDAILRSFMYAHTMDSV